MMKLQRRIGAAARSIASMAMFGLTSVVCPLEVRGETKTFEIDGVSWEVLLNGDHAELVKAQTGENQVIIIPSQFDGMPLTIIGGGAFNSNMSITSISLPSSLRVIGEASFAGCTGLTDVKIPEGVLTIDAYAFESCENLEAIVIPASVESIGSRAFGFCSNLMSVMFLGDAPYVGDDFCENMFTGTPTNMKIHVKKSTSGWVQWNNRSVYYDAPDSGGTGGDTDSNVLEWRYENDDGYAILTEDAQNGEPTISRHTKGTVTIPAEIDGLPVVEVSAYAFRGCQGMTEILVDPDSAFFVSVDGILYDADMKTLIRCPQKKTSVTVPEGVREIANGAFGGCEDLTSVLLPNTVEHIGMDAFYGCTSLRQITIPASVSTMDSCCLGGCMNLRAVNFEGDAPDVRCLICRRYQNSKFDRFGRQLFYVEVQSPNGSRCLTDEVMAQGEYRYVETDNGGYTYQPSYYAAYEYETVYRVFYDDNLNYDISGCPYDSGVSTNFPTYAHSYAIFDDSESWGVNEYARTSPQVVSYAKRGTCGWNRTNPLVEPEFWCGRSIVFTDNGDEQGEGKDSPGPSSGNLITLVTTNIVIHYIMQSAQSTIVAPVSEDVGIVNVVTEINGGNVAIPESWAVNFPNFTAKYGTDFTQALTKLSGKRDAAGNQMFVWQDYVAGTDPTDEKDVFRASITMSEGMPVISYTPELGETEAAKRKYTIWGKVRLQDSAWVQVENGDESNYNFFKVSVEMR